MNDFNKRTGWLAVRALFSLHSPGGLRWGRAGHTDRADRADRTDPVDHADRVRRRAARAAQRGQRQTTRAPGDDPRAAGPLRAQDGRGPNGGSDLDEMWRDFNQRFARLFERKGSGGSPRPGKNGRGGPGGRGARIGVGIVTGALIAGYAGSGTFVVQQGQKGVVLRLGQYLRTVDPGVYWHLPWPFETQRIVDVGQVRSVNVGSGVTVTESGMKDASVLTHDGGLFDVYFTVQYQVTQPADYLRLGAGAEQTVTQAAQAAVRALVGARSIGDMLDPERVQLLSAQLADAIQRALDASQAGLAVKGVTTLSVQAPDLAQAAFADATSAHQERVRATRDAQAQANQLLPAAQADAARMIDDAKTYSARAVAQTQGDAERFTRVYAQYQKAPAIVRERLYLDTMQDIYANTTKVFVDSKSSQNLIYLPLDRIAEALRQRPAAGASAPGTGAAQMLASTAAPVAGGGAGAGNGASGAGNPGGAASASGANVANTANATTNGAGAAARTGTAASSPADAGGAGGAKTPGGDAAAAAGEASRSRSRTRDALRERQTDFQ